jgi:hypothetical protein
VQGLLAKLGLIIVQDASIQPVAGSSDSNSISSTGTLTLSSACSASREVSISRSRSSFPGHPPF